MVKTKKAIEPADSEEWEALASSMRKTLARNLDFALEVAGVDDGGSVKKMKLTDFSRKTKVARSTLTKLTREEKPSKGVQANPDLNTICRLAAALNLPPAFLLMSTSDWMRLLGALNGLQEALSGPHLDQKTLKDAEHDTVSCGVNLVEKMRLYSNKAPYALSPQEAGVRQQEIDQDIEHANAMKLLAIRSTTAITQSSAKNYREMATLIAIGAIFGANFKPFERG
jgi:transcriptional regulator with XRE-family HTH domain